MRSFKKRSAPARTELARISQPARYSARRYLLSVALGIAIPALLVTLALWAKPEIVTNSVWVSGWATAGGALLLTITIALAEHRELGSSLRIRVPVFILASLTGAVVTAVWVFMPFWFWGKVDDATFNDLFLIIPGPLTGYLYIPALTAAALAIVFGRGEERITVSKAAAEDFENRSYNLWVATAWWSFLAVLLSIAAIATVGTHISNSATEGEVEVTVQHHDLLQDGKSWYQLLDNRYGVMVRFYTTDQSQGGTAELHKYDDDQVAFDSNITERVAAITTEVTPVTITVNGVVYTVNENVKTSVVLPGDPG